MDLKQLLQSIDLFEGLTETELSEVAHICTEMHYSQGQLIAKEGDAGNELYIITEGFVEVFLSERPSSASRIVVSLGVGQIIGEMALIDQGPRSASIRATSEPTVVQIIQRKSFEDLCQEDTRIGYKVMRNLAADISFKLRQRNLVDR